ncbi:hypothetical protein L6164_028537 [Bauhinia variegata]|uniref:Uncharacterized protein n=1 Tax=Bauhinia variegata TaxID=167791 RepID=A0ACB9L6T1_BAUVA|nr:hypothetical protein L6164_028537 [Bauhinia variegata]
MGDREDNGQEGEENLVQTLLRIQKNGSLDIPITNNNIKAVILDMFAAGTDTSATTLDWAMSEMMKNVRVRKKAQAEIREALEDLDMSESPGVVARRKNDLYMVPTCYYPPLHDNANW